MQLCGSVRLILIAIRHSYRHLLGQGELLHVMARSSLIPTVRFIIHKNYKFKTIEKKTKIFSFLFLFYCGFPKDDDIFKGSPAPVVTWMTGCSCVTSVSTESCITLKRHLYFKTGPLFVEIAFFSSVRQHVRLGHSSRSAGIGETLP